MIIFGGFISSSASLADIFYTRDSTPNNQHIFYKKILWRSYNHAMRIHVRRRNARAFSSLAFETLRSSLPTMIGHLKTKQTEFKGEHFLTLAHSR